MPRAAPARVGRDQRVTSAPANWIVPRARSFRKPDDGFERARLAHASASPDGRTRTRARNGEASLRGRMARAAVCSLRWRLPRARRVRRPSTDPQLANNRTSEGNFQRRCLAHGTRARVGYWIFGCSL
jgi:hypothetical protein